MPGMPPADENRSVTKRFGEFRIADVKTLVHLCERFFRTKNLFCEPALLDIILREVDAAGRTRYGRV